MPRRWEYYSTASGANPVKKEMQKLKITAWEAGRLDEARERIASGQGRVNIDFKPLGDGLFELLVDGQQRTFRLFYASVSDHAVLLRLHIVSKKRQRVPLAINLAKKRLRDWQSRQP